MVLNDEKERDRPLSLTFTPLVLLHNPTLLPTSTVVTRRPRVPLSSSKRDDASTVPFPSIYPSFNTRSVVRCVLVYAGPTPPLFGARLPFSLASNIRVTKSGVRMEASRG